MGNVLLAAYEDALIGLYFEHQKHIPDPVSLGWEKNSELPIFSQAEHELAQFLAGTRTTFDVPHSVVGGTPFQQSVWHYLATIPYGKTVSYKQVALAIGKVKAVRAAAAAVGRNPLTLIIPCHRIVGSDGALTGFAGGLARKKKLLGIEAGQACIS